MLEKRSSFDKQIVFTVVLQAVESLSSLATIIPAPAFATSFMPMLKRLATKDWFTSRASAATLVPPAYPRCPDNSKPEIRS